MKKRVLMLILGAVFLLNLPINGALASDFLSNEIEQNEFIVPKEIREKEYLEQLEKILDEIEPQSQYNYEYKTIKSGKKYKTVSGYLGNQPTKGSKFSNGGGVYYSKSGGPTVNGTVTIGLPGISSYTFGVSLGSVSNGSTGYFMTAPNRTNYFKAHASKKYEVEMIGTYRRIKGSNNSWQLYSKSPIRTLYSQIFSMKQM